MVPDEFLAQQAMRACAAVHSGSALAQAGGREKLADIQAQLADDP